MKQKRVLFLILVAFLMAVLVACGSSETNEPETGQQETQATPAPTPTPAPDATPPAEILSPYATIYEMAGDHVRANPNVRLIIQAALNDYQAAAIQDFEAMFGGTVDVTQVGWNQIGLQMQLALAAGGQWDLAFIEGRPNIPTFILNELIQPIDRFIDPYRPMQYMDRTTLDLFFVFGHHYAFTNQFISQPYVFFYNRNIFLEEGLETPSEMFNRGAWTHAALVELLDHFTRDTTGDGAIDQWGTNSRIQWHNMMYANSGRVVYVHPDGRMEPRIGSPENIQALEFLTGIMQAVGTLPHFTDTSIHDRTVVFFPEAEIGNGAWLRATTDRPDDIDFVPIPTFDGRLPITPVWDNGWVIPVGAENPYGGAMLAELIARQHWVYFKDDLQSNLTPEQFDRFNLMMTQTVPQQRPFPGVNMLAGNGQARDGMPAASIVEMFRHQIIEEVRIFNEVYIDIIADRD